MKVGVAGDLCRSWWGHSFWWRKGRRSGRAKLYSAIKKSAWVLEDDQREGFAMGFMSIANPLRLKRKLRFSVR